MRYIHREVMGKPIQAVCVKYGRTLWAHINGRTIQFEPEEMGSSSTAGKALDPNRLIAPMPGKVIKIMKTDGEQVVEQQVIIVMEAMKMEYSLKCQKAGKVKKILVQVGTQVQQGQLLAEME